MNPDRDDYGFGQPRPTGPETGPGCTKTDPRSNPDRGKRDARYADAEYDTVTQLTDDLIALALEQDDPAWAIEAIERHLSHN